jgi:Flp pilus assembly protein TadG
MTSKRGSFSKGTAVRLAFRRLLFEEDGAALVEATVIAPILVVMGVYAADFGLAFYDKMEMQNAAQAGAQWAIANRIYNCSSIQVAAQNATKLPAAGTSACTAASRACVKVTSYQFCSCSIGSSGNPNLTDPSSTTCTVAACTSAPGSACNTSGSGKLCHGEGGTRYDVQFIFSIPSDHQHAQYFRNNHGADSMNPKQLWDDTQGSALVEFTVTVPLFLLLTFGLLQAGLLLYTQAGLRHGVEVAARCASVNYSANQLQFSQSCFGVAPSTVIADTTCGYIKTYAAQNSLGVNPSLSTSNFTVTPPTNTGNICGAPSGGTCGANPGYIVSASYHYNIMGYLFSPTLSAQSCFPINIS